MNRVDFTGFLVKRRREGGGGAYLSGVYGESSHGSGLLGTGKAWRTVNNTQREVPLQSGNVTARTGGEAETSPA